MVLTKGNLPVVSSSFIKWKPVFIEQFHLGIGEEWLPHLGSINEGTNSELSDMTSDVNQVYQTCNLLWNLMSMVALLWLC